MRWGGTPSPPTPLASWLIMEPTTDGIRLNRTNQTAVASPFLAAVDPPRLGPTRAISCESFGTVTVGQSVDDLRHAVFDRRHGIRANTRAPSSARHRASAITSSTRTMGTGSGFEAAIANKILAMRSRRGGPASYKSGW
jgi:hypothetical protein